MPTVVGQELGLPLKKAVWEVDGRKEFGKSAGSILDGGADRHPSAIWIGRTGMGIKDNEDVPGGKS
jgi:hypothetical protein